LLACSSAAAIAACVVYLMEEDAKRTSRIASRMEFHDRLKEVAREIRNVSRKASASMKRIESLESSKPSEEEIRKEEKVSSYYFFSSDGRKHKNKWDTFDPDKAEVESIPASKKWASSCSEVRSQAREALVSTRNISKLLDEIAHDMAQSMSEMGPSPKLKSERRKLTLKVEKVERFCELLQDRSNGLFDELRKLEKIRNAQSAAAVVSASTTESNASPKAIPTKANKRPLTKVELERLQRKSESKHDTSASSWNMDGNTWEDRNISLTGRELLTQCLLEAESIAVKVAGVPSRARVTKVANVTGDASLTISPKKGRSVFFEFSFEIRWSVDSIASSSADVDILKENENVVGTMNYANVSVVDVEDEDIEIEANAWSVATGDRKHFADIAKGLQSAIAGKLREFLARLKARESACG